VSVNVSAELIAPVSLAAVLAGAREALRALLGPGVEAPEFVVYDGWRDHRRPEVPGRLGFEDLASLLVHDQTESDDAESRIESSVSPSRTCVGVVLATAVALGAASASGGRFFDVEIGMLGALVWAPARFVESARLRDGAGSFDQRCERFMRQFPSQNGWPTERSLPSA
jgi:hypothetical protein